MASANLQTVVVTRPAAGQVDDGEGGFLPGTAATVFSGQCRMTTDALRFSMSRDESEAGISTTVKRYFVWSKPGNPALLPEDRIQVTSLGGSPVYTVMFVWGEYSKTYQVEGYLLQ